jgi:hypothetical protein
MATEAEIRQALEAGQRFKPAILNVVYLPADDRMVFATPWGEKFAFRREIAELSNVPTELMSRIYASFGGVHIDEIDLDINGAGLLANLFPYLRAELANSF